MCPSPAEEEAEAEDGHESRDGEDVPWAGMAEIGEKLGDWTAFGVVFLRLYGFLAGDRLDSAEGRAFGWFRTGRDFRDWLRKLVAAWDGDDDLVAGLRAGERFAQEKDVLAEIALFYAGVRPQRFNQLVFGDDALGIQDEIGEQVEGLGADGDGAGTAMDGAMGEVDLEVLESVFASVFERHSWTEGAHATPAWRAAIATRQPGIPYGNRQSRSIQRFGFDSVPGRCKVARGENCRHLQ